jgi:hypothetical protein
MKKILMIVISSFLLFAPTLNGGGFAFDAEPGNPIELKDPQLTYICITTTGEAEGYYFDNDKDKTVKKRGGFRLRGSGVVLPRGYILTAAHVTEPVQVTLKKNDWHQHVAKATRCISKQIWITTGPSMDDDFEEPIPAKIVYIDVNSDVAILSYDHKNYDYLIPCPYKVEWTLEYSYYGPINRINISNPVAVVAYKRGDDDNRLPREFGIRNGRIIDNEVISRFPDVKASIPGDAYTIEMEIHWGDSGLPLFAWIDKKPVIIGVIHSIEATPMFGQYFDGAWAFVAKTDIVYSFLEGNL